MRIIKKEQLSSKDVMVSNWVMRDSQPEGFQIDESSFLKMETHEYLPIPLTGQWLKSFGFEIDTPFENSRPIYYKDGFYVDWDTLQPIDSGYDIAKVEIKYVHQLQNLYFALTGKELTKQ